MRVAATITTLLLCLHANATQPPEIRAMAEQLVPKVRVGDDSDFVAAWDLYYPGLGAV